MRSREYDKRQLLKQYLLYENKNTAGFEPAVFLL